MTKRAFAALITAALLVGASAGAYKPQCKDSSGRLIVCSGTLDNAQAPTAPAMSGANITANTIPAGSVSPGTVSDTEFGYLDGATSNIQSQINALSADVALATTGGNTFYLQEVASDIVGYETLRTQPSTAAEDFDEVIINSGTSPLLMDSYATDASVPGIAQWPAGNWIFHTHATVDSNGGDTRLVASVYSRTSGGVETLLFSATSPELDIGITEYQWNTIEPQFSLTAQTDRLVVKFFATTTSVGNRTVRIYYQGATRTSYVTTPIPSPLPISGPANQVLATPNGSSGQTALRQVVGADLASATIPYSAMATSATDRMLLNPALANNLVPVGNGTNWTAVGSITSGALLTAGATTPSWSTSLSGIIINAANNTVSNIATSMLASGFNLAATQGGTGQTSYTVGDVLYASTTTALSKLAAGTAGYPLTSNGAGVAPSYQAPITATHTCVTMSSSSVNLTTTYANLGITLTSLAAGTYLIVADVRTQINTSVGTGNAMVRLYNTTAGAEIANSERITNYSNGMIQGVTTPIHEVVTLGSTSTIDVQGATSAGTFSSATANTDGTGRSRACAIKVSP